MVKKIDSKEKVNKTISEGDLSKYLGIKNLILARLKKKIKLRLSLV